MQKVIIAAAVLLIVQIGLTVALNVNKRSMDAFIPQSNLLEFEVDLVNSVSIQGEEGGLLLEKKDSEWSLPEVYGVPADTTQISTLLDKLADLNQGLAVATSKEAAKRFRVGEEVFERHLVLKQDDKVVADLYVGTSPGFKQAHVRKAGQDEIITVALSTFELEPSAEKWLEKSLGQVKKEEVKALTFQDFKLSLEGEKWELDDLADGEELSSEEVKSLLNKVSDITVQGVLDPKEATRFLESDQVLKFTVIMKDESTIDYIFAKSETDHFVFNRSDREFYFKVSSWVVDDLTALDRKKLLKNTVVGEGEQERGEQGGQQ